MDRTGVRFDYRKCPRHGGVVELCVQDGQELTNIGWWCEQCHGMWYETYFTMKVEASLPVLDMHRQFSMACPKCSSRRVARACDPSCCNWHLCYDCGQHIDLLVKIDEKSPLSADELESLAMTVWLEGGVSYPDPSLENFETIRRTYPRCDFCDSKEPLLFSVDHGARDERIRFGWFCGKCETFNSDSHSPLHERGRDFFMRGERPDLRCPACGYAGFEQSDDFLKATCLTCRCVLSLEVEMTDDDGGPIEGK